MNVLYEARGVQLHAGVEDEEPGRAAFGFACTNTPAREDGNWRQLGGRPQAVPGLSAAPSPICPHVHGASPDRAERITARLVSSRRH